MRTTVSRWGDSLGIGVSHEIAQQAHITEGTAVDLRVEDGRLIVDSAEVESLDVLLARITPENLHGEQFGGESASRNAR